MPSTKSKLFYTSIILIILGIIYLQIFKANLLNILQISLTNIINAKVLYGQAGPGTFVLSTSLIGLGLIIAIITMDGGKKLNKLKGYSWIISSITFILAIIFSMIKLLLNNGNANPSIDILGNLSVLYLTIAIFSLLFWFFKIVFQIENKS